MLTIWSPNNRVIITKHGVYFYPYLNYIKYKELLNCTEAIVLDALIKYIDQINDRYAFMFILY